MQDINVVEYDPKDVIPYLNQRIDEILYYIPKLNKIKFKIMVNNITTDKISKNEIILDNKHTIYHNLYKLYKYSYQGLNDIYIFNLNYNDVLFYNQHKSEQLFLYLSYKKANILYYTSTIPQELILIIIYHFTSIDTKYKLLLDIYNSQLFSDILELTSIFGEFKENSSDVYLNI